MNFGYLILTATNLYNQVKSDINQIINNNIEIQMTNGKHTTTGYCQQQWDVILSFR